MPTEATFTSGLREEYNVWNPELYAENLGKILIDKISKKNTQGIVHTYGRIVGREIKHARVFWVHTLMWIAIIETMGRTSPKVFGRALSFGMVAAIPLNSLLKLSRVSSLELPNHGIKIKNFRDQLNNNLLALGGFAALAAGLLKAKPYMVGRSGTLARALPAIWAGAAIGHYLIWPPILNGDS